MRWKEYNEWKSGLSRGGGNETVLTVLGKKKSEQNIISLFAKNLKKKVSLIYFDEFQVTNIVDAMILGKLFDEIFKENIRIILTSNTKISELYKNNIDEYC